MQYLELYASELIGERTVQQVQKVSHLNMINTNNNITEALCFYKNCFLFSTLI